MTAEALLVTLIRLGAVLTPSPGGPLKINAPKGALTPDLLRALKERKEEVVALLSWDEATADRLLRATLARMALAYRAAYRERFLADRRWLEVEARIEATALARDMPAFLCALTEYEAFARRAFKEWAAEEAAR